VIERDNIIVDGAGFTFQGESAPGYNGINLIGRTNVTIENVVISYARGISLADSYGNVISGNNIVTNYGNAIYLSNSSNNSISRNSITANCGSGILLEYYSSNNVISENNIANNLFVGVKIMPNSMDNNIYHNNFMNNTSQASSSVGNVWDDGSKGNYWNDYSMMYPNAVEIDNSGVWNTPYTIGNDVDNYPLTAQYAIPEFPTLMLLPLFMIATVILVIAFKKKRLSRARSMKSVKSFQQNY
jgi:parallel beta-helix repeat protein